MIGDPDKKYKMEIKAGIDFDTIENEYDEDITEHIENIFIKILEREIHDRVLDNGDFHFWLAVKLSERTVIDIDNIGELGDFSLSISGLDEVEG